MALIMGSMGCGGEGTPEGTPTRTPEPTIPPDFTTYTDELQLFSISYPQSWEIALWVREGIEELTKDLLESIESGLPLENWGAVFFAGVPTNWAWFPNVNIGVEPLPEGMWTVDEVAEAAILTAKQLFLYKEYHEFSRVRTSIGGREAVVVDYEYEASIPSSPKTHLLQILMLRGRTAWTVTCSVEPERFSYFEETFYDIVRSFRILK